MKAHLQRTLAAGQRHLATALGRLRSRIASFSLATACAALALTLPMVLLLVLGSIGERVESWRDSYHFAAYLDPAVDDDAGQALADSWQALDTVADVNVITRQQAADDFAQATGAGDLITALGNNPLPVVIQVWPASTVVANDAVPDLADRLGASAEVVEIDTDSAWLDRANALHRTLQRVTLLVCALLAVIAVALIGSAVRQQLVSVSDEIALSKLVGARDSTLRAPFLFSGALIGLAAGILAICLTLIALGALAEPVAGLAASYQSDFQLGQVSLGNGALLLLGAVAIGVTGAALGIEYRLRRILPA